MATLSLHDQLQVELGQLLVAFGKACEAEEYQVGDRADARGLRRAKVVELDALIKAKRAEIAALVTPRRVLYIR